MTNVLRALLGKNKAKPAAAANEPLFKLHSYVNASGEFDYEQYRRIQEAGNKAKIEKSWATEENIRFVAAALKRRMPNFEFGICHGTRRGLEQAWFADALGCEVLGTEISETAEEFPNTIQWDFHEVKPEWKDSVDFVYSNAFDHSFDPERCIKAWMSCVRPGGYCVIEHSAKHAPDRSNELDPFGAELTHMPYLMTLWGKGEFYVTETLFPPATEKNKANGVAFLLIQRRRA